MGMIATGENLLKSAATASSESLTAARTRLEKKLRRAGDVLVDASQPVVDVTRKGAAATDDLVREHPWTVAGVAIAIGMLIGFLAAKRLGD